MVICFQCSSQIKRQLDLLLEVGGYDSYDEAIAVAVNNQVALELEPGSAPMSTSVAPTPQETTEEGRAVPVATGPARRLRPQVPRARTAVPEVFRLNGLPAEAPEVAEPPRLNWSAGDDVPIDYWIFGQFNRLLPVKAAVRALARLMASEPSGVPFDKAAKRIAEEAEGLGAHLQSIDISRGHDRDNHLATAFPIPKKGVEKSIQRFANQFVAAADASGGLHGLPYELGLLGTADGDRLLLTEAGWRFARIPNPILDETASASGYEKLSSAETSFLLHHISAHVPTEDSAFRAILGALQLGQDSPSLLGEHLRRYVTEEGRERLTDSFLSTQRSGAISRMADLGLVRRARSGVKVTYLATDLGEEYVSRAKLEGQVKQ